MAKPSRMETLCVQAGRRDDSPHRAAVLPIYQATTFALTEGSFRGMVEGKPRECLIYSRYGNPSIWSVEERMAALEGAESTVVTSSGMGAISAAVLSLTGPGDHVVAPIGTYGQTVVLLQRLARSCGRAFTPLPDAEPDTIRGALRPETRLVWVESVGNPLNAVADLPTLAGIAHDHGASLAVDATFATPVLQRPLELGADVSVHSATKYLGGHADLTAGVVAGSRERVDAAWDWMRLLGSCLDPHAAFLLERGLKTLHLRMERICRNALEVARFLEGHPAVARVHHPGLEGHPHHERAGRLLPRGTGGIVSFEHRDGDAGALDFCHRLEIFLEATSLGGVESLVSLPFNTSHANLSPRERAEAGIAPGTVRLAVGIEAAEDLIADLDGALAGTAAPRG